MKQTLLTLTFAVMVLTACTHSNPQPTVENQTSIEEDTNSVATNIQEEKDTIDDDLSVFHPDSNYTAKILTAGSFHHDEVSENAENQQWYGLFEGEQGSYLAQTKIKTESVRDEILDKNDEKTGWEVSVINDDPCIILIESLSFLTNRKIQSFEFENNYIYPQDTFVFTYLGIKYKIFATGKKSKGPQSPEGFGIQNYKLYLTADIRGERRTSLLAAQPGFDGAMVHIVFAGDIDGDGILDLIINASDHYNVTNLIVYLSRPAGNGEVVKSVGEHTSSGC